MPAPRVRLAPLPPSRSDGVALEAPIVALRLLEHLPEGTLPLTGLLVLLLDPQGNLHHAPGNVPIAPQGLHSLVVVAGTRGLVEEGPHASLSLQTSSICSREYSGFHSCTFCRISPIDVSAVTGTANMPKVVNTFTSGTWS